MDLNNTMNWFPGGEMQLGVDPDGGESLVLPDEHAESSGFLDTLGLGVDGSFFEDAMATDYHHNGALQDENSQEVAVHAAPAPVPQPPPPPPPPVDTPNNTETPPQPGRQQWDTMRPFLEVLYEEERKKVKEIVEIMKTRHAFHAREKQYTNHFKKWGFRKNVATKVMLIIVHIVNWRKMNFGKDTEVFVKDQRVPPYKITRFMRRKGLRATAPGPLGVTPSYIRWQTPPPTDSQSTSGGEIDLHGSSSATQDTLGASFALTGDSHLVWPVQNATTSNPVAQTWPNTTHDAPRVPLMLTSNDLDDLGTIGRLVLDVSPQWCRQRARHLLATAYTTPIREQACHDCGFLHGSVSASSLASIFDSTLPDLDMTNPSLVAILRLAIQHQEDALLQHLVRRCQQSDFAQRLHRHLLCMALKYGRGKLFRQLLFHGLDVDAAAEGGRGSANRSLLVQARMTLRKFIIASLDNVQTSSTAEVIAFLYRSCVITPTFWRDTVLWRALRNRRADVLRACLLPPTNAVLDIDALLNEAAEIRRIIQETRSSDAAAVLVAAARDNRDRLVSETGATALHLAASLLLDVEVRRLLAADVYVNETTETGETALHIIAGLPSDGNEVARILITRGASATATDSVGDSILHKAVQSPWPHWREELASMLIEAGADINATNHRGETPLIAAALNLDPKATKWLIKCDANAHALDCDGNSAYDYFPQGVQRNPLTSWENSTGVSEPWSAEILGEETRETSPRADAVRDHLRCFGFSM